MDTSDDLLLGMRDGAKTSFTWPEIGIQRQLITSWAIYCISVISAVHRMCSPYLQTLQCIQYVPQLSVPGFSPSKIYNSLDEIPSRG